MIELPQFQEWLIQLISMASNILIGAAAVIGISSIWQWRRELIGRTKFEVARRIILLALQYRDEFHDTRFGVAFVGEASERQRDEKETEAERRALDEQYAQSKRLQTLQSTLRKLHEAGWEADIILGEQDAALIEPLEKSYINLSTAMQMRFMSLYQRAKDPNHNIEMDQVQEDKKAFVIVYGARDDEVGKTVDNAINALKERLKAYVK